MAKKVVDTSALGLPKALDHEFREFCRGLVEVYGPGLRSIIVYGSLARKEYFAERSDINVLIVLSEADIDALRKAVDLVARARETCRVTPFFLTMHEIETSTDVFPIKFHDMRDAYVVVYGDDVLAGLEVKDDNLRLEIEQEMKILLLELRQFYLQRAKKGGASGAEHLIAYFNSFLYLLKRIMKLQGLNVPSLHEDLLRAAAKQYELDIEVLKRMLEYKRGRPIKEAVRESIPLYGAVAKMADVVDRMLVRS
jgi:predicted nucleotidyltransferase